MRGRASTRKAMRTGVNRGNQHLLLRAASGWLEPRHRVGPGAELGRAAWLHLHIVVQQGPVRERQQVSKQLPGVGMECIPQRVCQVAAQRPRERETRTGA